MSDTRSKKRFEAKQKVRSEKTATYVPLVVTFCDVGVDLKQRVVLYWSDDPDPEPTDENIIAVLPIRGELPRKRKEDIVMKFVTLASACLLESGEDSGWRLNGMKHAKPSPALAGDATTSDAAAAGDADNEFWPSLLADVNKKTT
jgi:hypothetical protein